MINTQAKSTLARLLAKENIEVREGNYPTAAFDVQNRVLHLPMWKDKGKDVYDLLVGHEVGHALFTPSEGWHDSDIDVEGIPRSYLNVIEDIRIERAIQRQYPGLVGSFKRGYQVLFDEDFFGTKDRALESYKLPDRINIKAKLADLTKIPFTSEEMPLVKQCFSVTTWEEVVEAARALYQYMIEQEQNDDKNTEDKTSSSPDNDDQGSGQGFESEIENEQENQGESNDAQDQSGDESVESEAADESEPEENQESGSAVEHSAGNDTSRIETDEAFRASEKELLEGDDQTLQPIAVSDLTRNDVENAIISYKEIIKGRDANLSYYGAGITSNEQLLCDYDQFMNDNDRVVKLMVKEFETRKAAFRYSRATTSKTGMLDTVKMHSYKYNEDIFARSTKLADSKSHGMFMLVDYSGSMQGTLAQIQRQVISLVSFCRKVNIPFRVLGFTSGENSKEFSTNLELGNVKIFELFSNEMSKSEFEKAIFQVYAQGWELQNCYGYPVHMSYDEHLGGTPLNETLIVLHKVVPEFKRKYNLDKVNLTILTDGESNSMYLRYQEGDTLPVDRRRAAVNINGKRIVIDSRFGTSTLIDEFRKQDITTLGYYIPGGNYDFRNAMYKCGIRCEEDIKERRREFMKQKFTTFDNVIGFDRYFVLRSGKDIDAKTEEFEVKEGAKKGELTRQFKKFAGSKKGNRVLATRFAEAIA